MMENKDFVWRGTKRKLASIQTIVDVLPHSNASKTALQLYQVCNSQVVAPAGLFKIGEKVIFLQRDSVCPSDAPYAKPLENSNFTVRSSVIAGEISQGFLVSTSVLPFTMIEELKVNDEDVTSILGIKKVFNKHDDHLLENATMNSKSGEFAEFPKYLIDETDEPRIQNEGKKLFAGFLNKEFYITEKIDGASATYMLDPEAESIESADLWVCSRSNQLLPEGKSWTYYESMAKTDLHSGYGRKLVTKKLSPPSVADEGKSETLVGINIYFDVVQRYSILEQLRRFPYYIIQGEVASPKLLGNRLNLDRPDFFVFNIKDRRTGKYLDFIQWIEACEAMKLQRVPIVAEGVFNHSMKQLTEMAKGFYRGTKNHREGIVCRLKTETRIAGERSSFKILNEDYLLATGKMKKKKTPPVVALTQGPRLVAASTSPYIPVVPKKEDTIASYLASNPHLTE